MKQYCNSKQVMHFAITIVAFLCFILPALPARSDNTYQVSSGEVSILQQYTTNLGTSTNDIALDIQMWNQSWVSSFNQSWSSANTGSYASGKLLPPDIAAFVAQTTSPYTPQTVAYYLSNGTSPLLTNQSEMDAFAGLIAAYTESIGDSIPDAIPQILNTRSNSVPPTKGDIVTFHVYNVILLGSQRCNQISSAQMIEWQALATSRNPIYRLLAAQAFSLIAPSSSWSTLYASYANETDPTIITSVINILWNTGLKSNIPVLQQIEQGQQSLGNTTSANNAAQAIQKLQSNGH